MQIRVDLEGVGGQLCVRLAAVLSKRKEAGRAVVGGARQQLLPL